MRNTHELVGEQSLIAEYEPLEPQISELEALRTARQNGIRSGYIEVAMGVGKTYAAALDVKHMLDETSPDARVLYLCHSPRILQDARETFEAVLPPHVTHGDLYAGQRDHETQTVYATFDTMNGAVAGVPRYRTFDPKAFDYIVIDEGHHGPAETYQPVIDYFQPDYQMLGQTGTAERMDGKRLEGIFGPKLFEYKLEEAIADGILTKPDYRLYTEQEKTVHETIASIGAVSLGDLNRRLANIRLNETFKDVIAKEIFAVQKENPDPRTVVYCPSIAYAEEFAQRLPGSLPLHSDLSPTDQAGRLKMFRQGYLPTLLVVDQLNEGVNVPEINTVVFLRGTGSKTVFLQQLGRGLRKAPGKDRVIVLDFAASWERIQLIADLKADVEQLHADPSRRTKRKRSTDRPASTPKDETPFAFTFSKEALDALDIIRKTRGAKDAEASIDPNKGKRLKQWDKTNALIRNMLGINRLPDQTLRAPEFETYGARISKGDADAKEEFVMRQLRSCMQTALKAYNEQHESSGLTLDDHFQNTVEGLYKLLDAYDPKKHGKFRNYMLLRTWNKPAKRALHKSAGIIKLPASAYGTLEEIDTFVEEHEEISDTKPSIQEATEALGIDYEEALELLHMRDVESLDTLRHLQGQGTEDIIESVASQMLKEDLREILDNLFFRERRVLELRNGLFGEHPQTFEEVGRVFNLTRERIRQIENQALKKLENLEEIELLRPYRWVTDSQEGLGKLPPTPLQIQQARKKLALLQVKTPQLHPGAEPTDDQRLMRLLEAYLEEYAPEVEVVPTIIEEERALALERQQAKATKQNTQPAVPVPHREPAKTTSRPDWDAIFDAEEKAREEHKNSTVKAPQDDIDQDLEAALRERDKINQRIAHLRRKAREDQA